METSSGASSGSSLYLQNSGSEQDLQQIMDQRKRKRMLSNRESARRSRMKKQKLLDDLVAQIGQLKKENNEILTSMNITTQLYNNLEAENSVLRAQMDELSNRLQSLNDIINFIDSSSVQLLDQINYEDATQINVPADYGLIIDNNPWNSTPLHVNQPIMASVPDDMFFY